MLKKERLRRVLSGFTCKAMSSQLGGRYRLKIKEYIKLNSVHIEVFNCSEAFSLREPLELHSSWFTIWTTKSKAIGAKRCAQKCITCKAEMTESSPTQHRERKAKLRLRLCLFFAGRPTTDTSTVSHRSSWSPLMDHQNRAGSKFGGGGVASTSATNADRRERLRKLALETIDLGS